MSAAVGSVSGTVEAYSSKRYANASNTSHHFTTLCQQIFIPGVTSNANTSTSKATSPANVLNASSSGRPISYRDVTPSRTPPTPLMQSRLAASRGLAPQWAAQNLDATGNFGQEGAFDNTANFGRSIGYL